MESVWTGRPVRGAGRCLRTGFLRGEYKKSPRFLGRTTGFWVILSSGRLPGACAPASGSSPVSGMTKDTILAPDHLNETQNQNNGQAHHANQNRALQHPFGTPCLFFFIIQKRLKKNNPKLWPTFNFVLIGRKGAEAAPVPYRNCTRARLPCRSQAGFRPACSRRQRQPPRAPSAPFRMGWAASGNIFGMEDANGLDFPHSVP